MERLIGICLGASSVGLVETINGKTREFKEKYQGNLSSAIEWLTIKAGISEKSRVVVTGRKRRNNASFKSVSEPEAIQRALKEFELNELPDSIVSFGGQTILAYKIDKRGRIVDAQTFNKCGSGTGDFFLQQIKRLGFNSVNEAITAASEKEAFGNPYIPASRCSVFCKSDCTHACNEHKATSAQIVAGICKMIAGKISELLSKIEAKKIWVVGGGSRIAPVINYLEKSGYDVIIPEFANNFEAWGASLIASDGNIFPKMLNGEMFSRSEKLFSSLPPLNNFSSRVEFKEMPRSEARAGDRCILAIDAGSTTTKLVLMRLNDLSIVSSYYGYTLGKPHIATLEGLNLMRKDNCAPIEIAGIVTTGSGRNLVETFLTDYKIKTPNGGLISQAVAVNEIICHAAAAEYFNPGVATILEIGGQDAKYTLLANGVPVDFAMNEACSAGTGSFLAEVVKELFDIEDPREIAPIALNGRSPIRFGEQCSAFIESDINSALGEGALKEDVVAGLCYSICFNYINRVVGNRPIIGPISVQGGTAYNKAFCQAMAGVLEISGLLGEKEKIIVNKDAGLMGAIGAALILKSMVEKNEYSLIATTADKLLSKTLKEGKPFVCAGKGSGQDCDYKCKIQNFEIDGVRVPFGGFCRRWEAARKNLKAVDPADFDLTMKRDKMLFSEFSDFNEGATNAPTVGFLGNLFDLSLMPFMSNFFARLGYRIILADKDEELYEKGVKRQGAAFCYPVERSHGLFANLIGKNPDFYWLPQIKGLDTGRAEKNQCCPVVQASPYYLAAAFGEIEKGKILNPFLDFSFSPEKVIEELTPLKFVIGASISEIVKAFWFAMEKQAEFERAKKEEGKKILAWLKENPNKTAVVIFGRPYNAFSGHLGANKGITRKIASMGVPVIPLDFLSLEKDEGEKKMYWPAGQMISRGTKFVANNPQLFAAYLTNFSCGPDSFVNYLFRHRLEDKPSLTLEFDGHTANAGFDTRVEAFLDIIKGYRKKAAGKKSAALSRFIPAKIAIKEGKGWYVDSKGMKIDFSDPRVNLVYPDMGSFGTEALVAATKSVGIRSMALPPADESCLQAGRRHSSCKECMPYNLTLGSFIRYLEKRNKDELTVFFMPDTSGPCRFGMYNQFMRLYVQKHKIPNVAFITLSAENKYSGLSPKFSERAWIAVNTAEAFENMAAAVRVLAKNSENGKVFLMKIWQDVIRHLSEGVGFGNFRKFKKFLSKEAYILSGIPLKKSLNETPKILIAGEIYVRKSRFTTEAIVERLVQDGFIVFKSPVTEWIKYNGLLIKRGINPNKGQSLIRNFFEKRYEKSIFEILSKSGLLENHVHNINETVAVAERFVSLKLQGEAILTVGTSLKEVFDRFAGIVVLGPFGCMPTRIASSILTYAMKGEERIKLSPRDRKIKALVEEFPECPMIVYEADGSNLSPIFQSQLDVFSLLAGNVGQMMANDYKIKPISIPHI